MRRTYSIWKNEGETPLQALARLRSRENIPDSAKLAFAGRLDPMASGVLLVLMGDECKKREKYLNLDKEYTFQVLLGVQTDTGDILGLVQKVGATLKVSVEEINTVTSSFIGTYLCEYPAFSSKPVKGKQLFMWALEGRLDEITLPKKEVMLYKLDFVAMETLNRGEVLIQVQNRIAKVPPVTESSKALGNDFRRAPVLESWRTWEKDAPEQVQVLTFRCVCSSGAYMRTLAKDIARELGLLGLAWNITRTKVGVYKKIVGKYGFWLKRY
jgi:tRNA pseudouridine55 synthase